MGFDLAEINVNVAQILTLHDPGYNILFLLYERIIDKSAFRFANALRDDLFGGLCRNPAEVARSYLDFGNVVKMIVGINLACRRQRNFRARIEDLLNYELAGVHLNRAGMAIHIHTHVLRRIKVSLVA
ncbi:hypothetical protein D3C81_1428870 [compost metagenome]